MSLMDDLAKVYYAQPMSGCISEFLTDSKIIEIMARAVCWCENDNGSSCCITCQKDGKCCGLYVHPERFSAVLTALRDAGLAIVPREPTAEMQKAGRGSLSGAATFEMAANCYRAMIATAEGK